MAKAAAKTKVKASKVTSSTAEWPGAFGIYKESSRVVKFNLITMLTLFLLSIVAGLFGGGEERNITLSILTNILSIVVAIAILATILAGTRSEKIGLSEAVESAFSMKGLKYISTQVLTVLALIVSFVLLIVPFFFVLPRIVLAPYFVFDKNLGPIDALKQSWAASKGHAAKIYGVLGVTLLFAILMFVIVGFYFIFMYQAAFALLYLHILSQAKKA